MAVIWADFTARRSATPVYVQLADWIERRIRAGDLAEGDQLPAERQLADLIGHSPETVSKARRLLIDRGLIESAQGIGSFVTGQG